jgi:hypothetical protein
VTGVFLKKSQMRISQGYDMLTAEAFFHVSEDAVTDEYGGSVK